MNAPLPTLSAAAASNSVERAAAALPGASAEEIVAALNVAVSRNHDAVFDLLWPRAVPDVLGAYPIAHAAASKNLHALDKMLPCPDPDAIEGAFGFAIHAEWEPGIHRLAASLAPGQVVPDVAYRAALRGSPALLVAVLPFASPADITSAFLHVATNGFEDKILVLLPRVDLSPIIARLLSVRQHDRIDALFALLPASLQLEMLAQHPTLAQFPNGAATAQRSHLEDAIPQSPEPRAPRM